MQFQYFSDCCLLIRRGRVNMKLGLLINATSKISAVWTWVCYVGSKNTSSVLWSTHQLQSLLWFWSARGHSWSTAVVPTTQANSPFSALFLTATMATNVPVYVWVLVCEFWVRSIPVLEHKICSHFRIPWCKIQTIIVPSFSENCKFRPQLPSAKLNLAKIGTRFVKKVASGQIWLGLSWRRRLA